MKTKEEVIQETIQKIMPELKLEQKLRYVYNRGVEAGRDDLANDYYHRGFNSGLEEAWTAARKIFAELEYSDVEKLFGEECAADNDRFYRKYSAQEAIEKLREFEERKKVKTNAQKFVEVFGKYDGDPRFYAKPEWWDEPYKEPEE